MNYYDLIEQEDAKILTTFNDDVKFFKQLIYNDKFSRIDATAVDKKNRKCHIEIKQRKGKYGDFYEFIDNYETIYIDCGKLDTFSNIMLESGYTLDEKELFISIFNDGDIILIHNITKPQKVLWLPNQKVWNEGKKQYEAEHKVGLFWFTALIYQKDKDGHYRRWTDDEIQYLMEQQRENSKLYTDGECSIKPR